jgi:hypothetical protein
MYLADPILPWFLLLLVALASYGPRRLRGPARTWALALLGVMFYKPISPYPHDYLNQPMVLVRKVALVPLVAWLLLTRRLTAPWRLLGLAALLVFSLPPIPPLHCSARWSLQALGPLAQGEDPEELGPGCFGLLSERDCGYERYRWEDFRRVLFYLREMTPPDQRVFSYLWAFPYPTVNGPSGRLTPIPAAGGYVHLLTIDPSKADAYAAILERGSDILAVWDPTLVNFDFPQIDRALRECYQVEVRFGTIEIWRHRAARSTRTTTVEAPGREGVTRECAQH